jgi:quercetin dioxygenase-like cupin family protein
MESDPGKRASFAKSLPQPDKEVLTWIGEQLSKFRGKKTPEEIAKRAGISAEEIEKIEKGVIHQDLGYFRHILREGYGRELEELLEKCHDIFHKKFNPTGRRRFDRDYYYAICLQNEGKKAATPFLVGGDPDNYLWAVPIRKLSGQPLAVELLEIAPKRKRKHLGEILPHSHGGIEVVHIINGTVTVTVDVGSDDAPSRSLKSGDSIHFNSQQEHYITNEGNSTPALLLIVRLPYDPKSKP